ncbi:MAG: hypothetical protein ACREUU_16755 [Gammaproteobacteria bacterium]
MSTVLGSKPLAGMLTGLLAALMCGCAASAGPSEAAAREVFEERLRDGLSKGAIRIRSFQKTSGPTNVPPGDTYVVAFQAQIECLKEYRGFYCGRGCRQGTLIRVEEGSGRLKIAYDTEKPAAETIQKGTNLTTGATGMRLASYEEENKWAGLQFTRTWRGWRSNGGKLY